MKALFGVFVCVLSFSSMAQSLPCLVTSTNLGNGFFSYTFARGDAEFVWGIGDTPSSIPHSSWIVLQSFEVMEIQNPPGWTASVTNGLIRWESTNGIVYLDAPVTFIVRSSLAGAAEYGHPCPDNPDCPFGAVIGPVFRISDHVLAGGGIQYFSYVGPALPKLTIEFHDTHFVLSWPTNAVGFDLEEKSASSADAAWSPVASAPSVDGPNKILAVEATDTSRLFRLHRP